MLCHFVNINTYTLIFFLIFDYIANIVVLGQGCSIGWVSPSLLILQSDQTPLDQGSITLAETSWIGSMASFGAAVGTLFFGLITSSIGSKNSMILCAFPLAVIYNK